MKIVGANFKYLILYIYPILIGTKKPTEVWQLMFGRPKWFVSRLFTGALTTFLSVSLTDEGFCVGVGDIVLERCCTDVSVMQSVFPVRERKSKKERERKVKKE